MIAPLLAHSEMTGARHVVVELAPFAFAALVYPIALLRTRRTTPFDGQHVASRADCSVDHK